MTKTCEAIYCDGVKVGRPIWNKEKKDVIDHYDDGWRKCGFSAGAGSRGEVVVSGRRHLVCKEHKRQIELLQRDNSPLLAKIRWAA